MLSRFSGAVIPVHHDPRFTLSLKIEDCTPEAGDIATGAVVNFAIHSPARLLPSDNPKGSTFWFSVKRESTDGRVRFHDLQVEKKESEPRTKTAASPIPAP